MNKLREKLKTGRPLCGTHVTLTDPCICDIIGRHDIDFIWVDTEHSHLSLQDVLIHIMAANQHDMPVIVRVPRQDFNFTKRVLEMGPAGVVFPVITSAAQAREAMEYTLYPPRGVRGFGPLRAVGYGEMDTRAYVEAEHTEMCRFIQLEHVSAIETLPEIMDNIWIDGYFFGPNDLAASVGHLGEKRHPETVALMERAIAMLRKRGKPVGVSLGETDPETIRFYHEMGVTIISSGADYGHIMDGTAQTAARVRSIQAEKELAHHGN